MGLSFFESMRGELVDLQGVPHLADFDIKAEATHLRRLVRTGSIRITGIVRAPRWAMDLPLEGELRVSLLRDRRISYDFGFTDQADRRYRLSGHKALSPLRPLHSMTHMSARLWCEGALVAEGELRFDLNDLPAFATSWSLSTSIRALDLGAPPVADAPGLSPLSDRERATLWAYAEALVEPGVHVPAADGETLERALALLPHMPATVRLAYRAMLRLLDAAALARRGRRFGDLSIEARRSLLEALDSPRVAGGALNLVLGFPVKTAHFSRRDYLDSIGVPHFDNPVQEPEPAWRANVLAPEDLEAETTVEADVVVIGTGAGGGPVAALLAERGLAVAVVEEGLYVPRSAFSGSPEERVLRYWRDGGMTMSLGNCSLAIPTGKLVGGTTAINSGTCFPTPEAVLGEWRELHGLDGFTADAFAPYLQRVLDELQVEPADRRWVGDIAKIVARGADQMGVEHGPLPRNAPSCDGQGTCSMGCPTGAKRSTDVSYIPRALRAGATLFTGLPVTRLLRRGPRVVAVEARGQDRHGAPRVLRIRARAVVVAAGTFGSPLLLRDNGFELPQLGKNLSVHPALGFLAMSDQIHEPWKAIPQSYGIEGLVDPRIRYEGFYAPPQLNAAAIPHIGPALTRWMDAQGSLGQFGFMVRDRNVGSVRRGPDGRPLVRYDLTPDALGLLQSGSAALAELLLRGGASEVLVNLGPVREVRTVDEARALGSLRLRPSDFRAMAFHPLGTCRMGRDANQGVVDSDHRVFGTRNLFVIDGSTVPTSLGVNPQVTIMAMAERAATRLGERLDAE